MFIKVNKYEPCYVARHSFYFQLNDLLLTTANPLA